MVHGPRTLADLQAGGVDLSQVAPGDGPAARWQWSAFDDRLLGRSYDDYNDLYVWIRRDAPTATVEHVLTLAHLYIHSTGSQPCQLRLGSNDGVAAYVNGERVLTQDAPRAAKPDQDSVPVRLSAGWNRLLLVVSNVSGIYGFYARLTNERGEEPQGVTFSLRGPAKALRVDTEALPSGYVGWPYVELDNRGGPPKASAFRLLAGGGEPPYRWELVGRRPEGLLMRSMLGELVWTPTEPGRDAITALVVDSKGRKARRTLSLQVAEPPTAWFTQARFGMFNHYNAWRGETPEQFDAGATQFNAEDWAQLAKDAGCRYYVITSKHHPGFCIWPTQVKTSDGRSLCTKRDYLGELQAACEKRDIRFGVYYSTLDRFNPDYQGSFPAYTSYQHAHVEELCRQYKPWVIWFDGHWSNPGANWEYDALFSLIHALRPQCVIINNPGLGGAPNNDIGHGDIDARTFEANAYWEHPPEPQAANRNPKPLPAEKAAFVGDGWAPSLRDPEKGMTKNDSWTEWLKVLATCAGTGGPQGSNLLLNVGPDSPSGNIPEPVRQVFRSIGEWLKPRGEAFYGTAAGSLQGEWGVSTQKGAAIYLHILKRPGSRLTFWNLERHVARATVIPTGQTIRVIQTGNSVDLDLTDVQADAVHTIIKLELGQ
jgi:alpha-L-fucosidase